MQLEPIVWEGSLEPLTRAVKYRGEDYVLLELSGPDMSKFKSALAAGVKLDGEGGMTRLSGSGDLDPLLVSLSLNKVLQDGTRSRVTRAFVDALPPKFTMQLADAARELNPALDEVGATVEQLDKQIERLIALRDKLMVGETPSKNSRNGTS